MLEKNLYRILQVDPRATTEVIRAAYKVLARGLHPERDSSGLDEWRLTELKRAYAILRDPDQRHAYDMELAAESMVPVGPGQNGNGHSPSLGARVEESLAARIKSHVEAPDRRIDFGRYQSYTLGEVVRMDPDYARWLSRHSSGVRYRRAILQLLADYDKTQVASHHVASHR